MSKIVNVSDDSGSTWYPIPGQAAAFQADGDQLDDSILGQTFESGLTGLITWNISGDAFYKGYSGYVADLKQSGTLTATTGEAMSQESGQIYRIDDGTKEVWDWDATLTVYDGVSDVTAQVESIDYLFGRITFAGAYTVLGAITIDVSYYPVATFGKGRSFTLTQTVNAIDTSDYQTVQANGGYKTHSAGLRTVTLDIEGIFDASDAWQTELSNRNAVLIEINADGAGLSTARGWFRLTSAGQEGNVGDNETESISFVLNVDDSNVVPFGWFHESGSTLSTGMQVVLTAFEDQTDIDAQYLYDGTSGYEGTVVVTEASLSSSIDDMNTFSYSLTGDGAFAAA